MKVHSTNYYNTFIEIAEDCPAPVGEVPPQKGDAKTAVLIQFEMIMKHPYKYSSDDVLFQVYAEKKDLLKTEYKQAREEFFSKGQPCLRASALGKRYGWGVHSNQEGKVALYAAGSQEYEKFMKDKSVQKVKAMKSAR